MKAAGDTKLNAHLIDMIRLLSTDFDGTLINHIAKPPVVPELFTMLRHLHGEGVKWAVNTGRTLWHLEQGIREEYRFPVEPDFVIVEERDIYRRTRSGGWEPFGEWNQRSAAHLEELFRLAGPLLTEVLAFLERLDGAQPIHDRGRFIGAMTGTLEDMDRLCVFLDKLRAGMPVFNYQRNTIYVRFCHIDYSKGTALGELTRYLGLPPAQVFAAGDHHNDLPMLDPRFAGFITCPSNSCEEVKLAVRTAGGYLARGEASAGVVEALRHFGIEK
jgi:3-deoxy-D-manno-octulosonate 8-phosphate phosphatase KdsC-like HAD superfamily phosphatase